MCVCVRARACVRACVFSGHKEIRKSFKFQSQFTDKDFNEIEKSERSCLDILHKTKRNSSLKFPVSK